MKKQLSFIAAIAFIIGSVSSVFAAGGVLPDGLGTNWSYGDLYGQGVYYLRNWQTEAVDGAGVTNIDAANIASGGTLPALDAGALTNIDAANIASGSTLPALDAGALTNVPGLAAGSTMEAVDGAAITNLTADNIAPGGTITAIDGGAITNIDAANIAAGSTLPAVDGAAVTNIGFAGLDEDIVGQFLTTNDTSQSKAGALTLNGTATMSSNVVFAPSAVQTIATDDTIAANGAVVQVVSDGGAVTATFADGTTDGQVLKIIGTSDTDTVRLTNAPVVPIFTLGDKDVIQFFWNSAWLEDFRRDN